MEQINVLPATEKDALDLARIESAAFDPPPRGSTNDHQSLGRVMFGPPSAAKDAVRAAELVEKIISSPESRIYKAVVNVPDGQEQQQENGEGKIAGLAMWKFYTSPLSTENTWTDLPWEGAANPTACNDFFGGLERLRTKHMGGKRFALLSVLAVHPDYQGKGIGAKLIQRGLDEAASLGLEEAFLEATTAGHGLYVKFGWRDVENFPVDLAKYGGRGVWNTMAMKRG